MSCDRSLLALEGSAGPHIVQSGFASTGMEYTRANGVDAEKSPPPQRAIQRPHTSGTVGSNGLLGSTSDRLRGVQNWCACNTVYACLLVVANGVSGSLHLLNAAVRLGMYMHSSRHSDS